MTLFPPFLAASDSLMEWWEERCQFSCFEIGYFLPTRICCSPPFRICWNTFIWFLLWICPLTLQIFSVWIVAFSTFDILFGIPLKHRGNVTHLISWNKFWMKIVDFNDGNFYKMMGWEWFFQGPWKLAFSSQHI